MKDTKMKEKQIKEWNDTHIPRGRVGHHATGIPKKYWIAIGDDVLINNYSEFVNQSLQLKPLAGNATPSFTTQDIMKAKELALRAVKKFPDKYVFFGVDDTSRGVMTGKNHLRASVRYYYDPTVRMWNDNELFGEAADDKQVDENEFLHDETDHPIVTVGDLKKVLSNFKDYDKINVCDNEGIPDYKIVSLWNTEYERSMVADPNDVDDNTCYIRIGRI